MMRVDPDIFRSDDPKNRPLSIADACSHRLLAREDGKPCGYPKLYRLMMSGSRAIDGRTVPLGSIMTPSGRRTTIALIEKFFADLNRHADSSLPPDIATAHAAAEAKLSAMGI